MCRRCPADAPELAQRAAPREDRHLLKRLRTDPALGLTATQRKTWMGTDGRIDVGYRLTYLPEEMLRPILIHPDPRLKKVCDPVPEIDDAVRALAGDMLDTMYAAPGIGLAAPQIGVNARMLVMDCAKREDKDVPEPICMINPEIISAADELVESEEGCLSIPDIYAQVKRPKSVQIRHIDEHGKEHERVFEGIWAVCVQHEIDHLNGKLFIDYLSPMRRQMITSKMKKLKRERARG